MQSKTRAVTAGSRKSAKYLADRQKYSQASRAVQWEQCRRCKYFLDIASCCSSTLFGIVCSWVDIA